jgi:hypothetical protein
MTDDNPRENRRRRWLATMAVALLVAAAGGVMRGCGGGEEELVAPTTQPSEPNEPPDPLIGRWEGMWDSDGIHGSGELVSVIRRQGEGEYLATFRAKFGGGLFSMTQRDVTLHVTGRSHRRVEFEGQKDLGFMNGGVYTYTGSVEDGVFKASYESSFDTGMFTMRPADESEPTDDANDAGGAAGA